MSHDYNQYDDEPSVAEPEPDPRVIAMHRVVELEQQHQWATRDADERQKKAAIIGEELSEARDVLHGLLGFPSRANVKAMDSETAQSIAVGRRY